MSPIHLYRAGRTAMRCWCEVFLCGDDRGHLAAVAELALKEITHVERMLSRFDPASEVFRLNAAVMDVPFRVSPELFAILVDCREWWTHTRGAFDVTVSSTTKDAATRWNAIHFDADRHTITRSMDGITFDFGGYGKGYAIDRALSVIQEHGITSACLHAGTSSIVASDPPPDVAGWPIAIRHLGDTERIVAEWSLCHAGISTSASLCAEPSVLCAGLPTPHSSLTDGLLINDTVAHNPGDLRSNISAGSGDPRTTARSDIVDLIHGSQLIVPASCTVMATNATKAEVWSTALLIDETIAATTNDVQRVFWQRFMNGEWSARSSP